MIKSQSTSKILIVKIVKLHHLKFNVIENHMVRKTKRCLQSSSILKVFLPNLKMYTTAVTSRYNLRSDETFSNMNLACDDERTVSLCYLTLNRL